MTDQFRTAVKKAAEAAPSDLTTFIANTTQQNLNDTSFRAPSGTRKKQHDLEQEFERFMSELVDRGLIGESQDQDDGDQIVLGDVEGMEDWKEVLDSMTQRKYYWNDRTDEVVWEDPRNKANVGVEPVEQESNSYPSCLPSPHLDDTEEELIGLLRKLKELQCPVDGKASDEGQCSGAVDAFKQLWIKLVEHLQDVISSSCSTVFNEELSAALERVTSLLNHHSRNSDTDEDNLNCNTSKDNDRIASD